jgi:uncharacterized protein (TIGR03545 family)
MKQWIRWSGLLGFIAVVALLVLGWMFAAGPLIKYSIETFGSQAAKAKVEVEDVSLSFSPFGIEVTGVQVANADKPMENVLQFDRAIADLELLPLLLGKGIVNEVVLSGVEFSTPRQSSGALVDEAQGDENSDSNTENDSTTTTEKISQSLPSADEILAREPLLTEQRGRKFQSSFTEIKADSDKAISALPDSKDLASYEEEFNSLTSGEFKSLEDFQQRKKEFDALKKRIKQDQKAISEAKTVLSKGKDSLTQQWADLKAAPGQDLNNLKNKYSLDGAGAANLSRLMFGDAAGEWSEEGLYWYEKIRPFLTSEESDVDGESEDVKSTRREGRFVHFESDRPLPDLLIRKMQLMVKLPEAQGQPEGESMGDLAISVYDITHQQKVTNKPITFVATGKNLKDIQSLALNGSLDYRSTPGTDTLDLNVKGVSLKDYDVGAMGLKLDSSQIDIVGKAQVIAGEIDATSKAEFSKAVFSSKDKTQVAKEMAKALQKIDRFDIDAFAKGALIAPKVDINSDLDSKLNVAFNQRIDEKQEELEETIKEKLNDKLLAYAGDYQEQLKTMDVANGSLSDKQDQLDTLAKSELSSFQDQEEAKLKAEADEKKKQLEDDLKDKFKKLF